MASTDSSGETLDKAKLESMTNEQLIELIQRNTPSSGRAQEGGKTEEKKLWKPASKPRKENASKERASNGKSWAQAAAQDPYENPQPSTSASAYAADVTRSLDEGWRFQGAARRSKSQLRRQTMDTEGKSTAEEAKKATIEGLVLAISHLVGVNVRIDERELLRYAGATAPASFRMTKAYLERTLDYAKKYGPDYNIPPWLKPVERSLTKPKAAARTSRPTQLDVQRSFDKKVRGYSHRSASSNNRNNYGKSLKSRGDESNSSDEEEATSKKPARIPKKIDRASARAEDREGNEEDGEEGISRESFAALPPKMQETLAAAHPRLQRFMDQAITNRVRNRLADPIPRTPPMKRKPRRAECPGSAASAFSPSGLTPNNKKKNESKLDAMSSSSEEGEEEEKIAEEEEKKRTKATDESLPRQGKDKKKIIDKGPHAYVGKASAKKAHYKPSAAQIGARKGDIQLVLHGSLDQKLPVSKADWEILRVAMTAMLKETGFSTRVCVWDKAGVIIMARGRASAEGIKTWFKSQKIGFKSYRAWENEEPDSFKLKIQLPNAVSGRWEDLLADLFERSSLTWDGHVIGEPFCTTMTTPSGTGRFRVIWLFVDHVLLRQVMDVVAANNNDKSAFPALDAVLEIKYSTTGAFAHLARFESQTMDAENNGERIASGDDEKAVETMDSEDQPGEEEGGKEKENVNL